MRNKRIITPEEVKKKYIDCDQGYDKLIDKINRGKTKRSLLKKYYDTEQAIYEIINKFTLEDTEYEDFVDLVRSHRKFKEVNIEPVKIMTLKDDTKALLITAGKQSIKVAKLKDVFKGNILDALPKLSTKERYDQCHWGSITLSTMLTRAGVDNKIVTGMIADGSNDARVLHSWVEVVFDGKEWVMDFNMGAYISKEGYYMIQHPKKMVAISGRDIYLERNVIHDLHAIKDNTDYDYLIKLYLMDRASALDLYEYHYGVELGPIDVESALKDESLIYPSIEELKKEEVST